MALPLIIYAVFATVVLVFCTISRVGPRVEYIGISIEALKDLVRKRDDLIVVDLRKTRSEIIANSRRVPVEELKGFLQWVPERSTLVLCGFKEVACCRDELEMTLFGLGIQFVFVIDDDLTKMPLAERGSLSFHNYPLHNIHWHDCKEPPGAYQIEVEKPRIQEAHPAGRDPARTGCNGDRFRNGGWVHLGYRSGRSGCAAGQCHFRHSQHSGGPNLCRGISR